MQSQHTCIAMLSPPTTTLIIMSWGITLPVLPSKLVHLTYTDGNTATTYNDTHHLVMVCCSSSSVVTACSPDKLNASRKVRSPSSLRKRFCKTSMSCRVPLSKKCRRNWLAVLLLKKDRSNSLMCLKRSLSISSFLVATIAATAVSLLQPVSVKLSQELSHRLNPVACHSPPCFAVRTLDDSHP